MASKTWIGTGGTLGSYSDSANWSPSGVPAAGDLVRIPAGSPSITAGLDQHTVALASFIVEPGYVNALGTTAANLQIAPAVFRYDGAGTAYLDFGTTTVSPQVSNSATAATGLYAIYMIGSGIATASITAGSVGVAARSGETATVTEVKVLGGTVLVGTGCTLTTMTQLGGSSEQHCASTTTTVWGGTWKSKEVGTITTLTVNGGTAYAESTGTITTATLNSGGTIKTLGSGLPRIITTLNHNNGTIVYDPAVLTITNRAAPSGPVNITVASGV